jgi:deoxyribonuclease V
VKACLDVQYRTEGAIVGCVLFSDWGDASAARELVELVPMKPAAYEPGSFYRRELPCLLRVLEPLRGSLELVIVDGYVWLDEKGRPGLGAHLHEALGGAIPVIGVAKTAFAGSTFAVPVLRGTSKRPLYVTAVGVDAREAGRSIASMHGTDRLPTLLKRVDQLARSDP